MEVGDLVVVVAYGIPVSVTTIVRETKNFFVVTNGDKYRKSDWHLPGESRGVERIEPITQARVYELRQANLSRFMSTKVPWYKLPLPDLEKVYDIVKTYLISNEE